MRQDTFNNYQHAATIASVNLTTELVEDIQNGSRMPLLNGTPVSFREKIISAYFLNVYATILQEYTLTDIAGNDKDNNPAQNRLTREEMKEVLEGINLLSGIGLNSREDFVLDR